MARVRVLVTLERANQSKANARFCVSVTNLCCASLPRLPARIACTHPGVRACSRIDFMCNAGMASLVGIVHMDADEGDSLNSTSTTLPPRTFAPVPFEDKENTPPTSSSTLAVKTTAQKAAPVRQPLRELQIIPEHYAALAHQHRAQSTTQTREAKAGSTSAPAASV